MAEESNETPFEMLTKKVTDSMMKAVNESLDSKLTETTASWMSQVNEALADNSMDISEKAAKKLKMSSDLKNPGNVDQFDHNAEVLRCVEKAEAKLLKGEAHATYEQLSQAKKLINQRQKIVRLADREEDGWRFIKEYVSDKLADDSDDEKAISKARKAAAAKKKNDAQKKKLKNKSYSTPTTSTNRGFYSSATVSRNYGRQSYPRPVPNTDFRRDRYDRECFACGRRGHLLINCPNRTNGGRSNIR